MRISLTTLVALLLFVLGACDNKDQGSSKTTPSSTAAAAATQKTHAHTGHAKPGVKAGSHEDWCGEHAVPESMCTRCNASLIPAFKATGDWCKEHNLPESQCLICNPGLKIVRPPKTAGK